MRKFITFASILLAVAAAWYFGARFGLPQPTHSLAENEAADNHFEPVVPTTIRGQGKLKPAAGFINIVAVPGDRVEAMVNKQIGDQVDLGEVLITLHSRVLRERDLELAQARRADALNNAEFEKQQATFKLKSAQLALDEANASVNKISEQAKAIRLLADQLRVAQQLSQRLQNLQSATATKTLVNQTDIDKQNLLVEQLKQQKEQAQFDLEMANNSAVRAKEVAQNNLATVEYSLANADDAAPIQSLNAAVALAQQAYDLTQIRSPIQGTILDIIVHAGDSVTNQPIMVLAELSQMNCEAEIVDSLFGRINIEEHQNLRARMSGNALQKPLMGTVVAKGMLIGSLSLKSPNPFAKVDQRTGIVTIKLDDPQTAAKFVNLQVDVEIEVEPGTLLKSD